MGGRFLVGWLIGLSIGLYAQLDWDYRKADSVAGVYAGHALHDLKSLSDKLTLPFTSEVNKFRAIYTWTCLNVDNDYLLFLRNKFKREKFAGNPTKLKQWNDDFNKAMFRQLRLHKRTICTGYAYVIRELAKHAGIQCVMVDGYGRSAQANVGGAGTPNHTWNAVHLDNKWYLCDATWSSGVINGTTHSFQRQYDDAYFLTDPDLFARNHYPLDTTWLLLNKELTLQQFMNRPLAYKSLLRQKIHSISPDTLHLTVRKGEPIRFEFANSCNTLVQAELRVQTDKASTRFIEDFDFVGDGLYKAECVLKTKGSYTIHTVVNREFVMSYAVRVIN